MRADDPEVFRVVLILVTYGGSRSAACGGHVVDHVVLHYCGWLEVLIRATTGHLQYVAVLWGVTVCLQHRMSHEILYDTTCWARRYVEV